MKIYNTLTRQKEEFKPIEENKVRMYVCGPTVYNYIHIGNARPLVFFDTVRRYFEFKGFDVKFVMNFTDIDDKIINKAIEEDVDYKLITEKYIQAFKDNAKSLNVDDSKITHVKATEYVGKMIKFIKGLEDIGAAYDTEDTVYFSVDKAKDYGKLSKKNIEDLVAGARVDLNEDKKNPMDFALWKKKKLEKEPAWKSPWGLGRPGWHIECSVMAKDTLGDTIDIHGGGEDLQFPHHENEIAQSETLHQHTFANYWMHNSMITIDSQKMSKSKGNFFTLHDIEKHYDLKIIRMWLISSHYRSPLDFSSQSLDAIKASYDRLNNTYERLTSFDSSALTEKQDQILNQELVSLKKSFENAMDDDFNTSHAMAFLFDLSKLINTRLSSELSKIEYELMKNTFKEMTQILGIKFEIKDESLEKEILDLIEKRDAFRREKNWAKADEIRDRLKSMNIELKDTAQGVTWKKIQ
ncbi:MAG: cysteine--tRNA ligase [Tissierellia bacterium]|nr:cysteine--tRNA ligase [Tissierellia bacterium]